MAAHFTMSDLRNIRTTYESLGITNSDVYDKVTETIKLLHFKSDEIEELQDIFSEYNKISQLDPFQAGTLEKVNMIGKLQEYKKINQSRQNHLMLHKVA